MRKNRECKLPSCGGKFLPKKRHQRFCCSQHKTQYFNKFAKTLCRSGAYQTWYKMIRRCTNPKTTDFKFYMGRGITVCKRWFLFENFLKDMGERPVGMEIDRIDNNQGYSSDNCRWVTHKENCRNFRRNRLITLNGETLPLIEWAEKTGLSYDAIRGRLDKGWPIEKALAAPANSTRSEGARRGNLKRLKKKEVA